MGKTEDAEEAIGEKGTVVLDEVKEIQERHKGSAEHGADRGADEDGRREGRGSGGGGDRKARESENRGSQEAVARLAGEARVVGRYSDCGRGNSGGLVAASSVLRRHEWR